MVSNVSRNCSAFRLIFQSSVELSQSDDKPLFHLIVKEKIKGFINSNSNRDLCCMKVHCCIVYLYLYLCLYLYTHIYIHTYISTYIWGSQKDITGFNEFFITHCNIWERMLDLKLPVAYYMEVRDTIASYTAEQGQGASLEGWHCNVWISATELLLLLPKTNIRYATWDNTVEELPFRLTS